MTSQNRMPALFIGHGSPMNAIEDGEFSRAWSEVAGLFPRPEAVLCVSAHWETRGVKLTSAARPGTIHDFYGFPDELYAVRYPAPGSPELAGAIAERLAEELGGGVGLDAERGLDHGAWSVLRRMYPDADLPVVQLSLDSSRPAAFHYQLGRALSGLRERGVLLLGSGDIVHNLRLYDFHDETPRNWAEAYDAEICRYILDNLPEKVVNYRELPNAALAVPTPEHYLPLLYVLGTRAADEPARIFCRKTLSSLSMTSVAFGLGA